MTAPTANLMVLVGERFACVKVAGRANFANAVDFKTILTELVVKDFPCIVIDLSDCQLMDSTFLGVLAASGVRMIPAEGECIKQAIELRNANERLLELLENLGVLHLFKTFDGQLPDCQQIKSETCQPTREAITQASLEAHQTLMDINPDNVAKFKDVTRFLAEDLEKLRDRSSRN